MLICYGCKPIFELHCIEYNPLQFATSAKFSSIALYNSITWLTFRLFLGKPVISIR